MDPIDPICLRCQHYEKPNGYGCRAFPDGIPYGFPPSNKHRRPLPGQVGQFVFAPAMPDPVGQMVGAQYKNLRKKTAFDFAPDTLVVSLGLPAPGKAESIAVWLNRPAENARALLAVAEILPDPELEKAVSAQFSAELRTLFNE